MSTEKLPPGIGRKDADPGGTRCGLDICARLAEVRRSYAGDRGAARFARELGISTSTYSNYEKNRVPPPQLLARVAELTGADLVWLLTGRTPEGPAGQVKWASNPGHRAILARAAGLLADRPGSLAALAAFLDLLEEKARLEQSLSLPKPAAAAAGQPGRQVDLGRWVPVFGRAAAGLARFWDELGATATGPPGTSALDRMVHQAAQSPDAESRPASLRLLPGEDQAALPAERTAAESLPGKITPLPVRLVQLSEPVTDYQLTEFVDAPGLAGRYPRLFGLRLDGDSMAPMFPDGAIVLCCPGEPAQPGRPAVVRLAGQIGVTCKIYRPRGAMVRLVPANDAYPAQEFPARQLDWALAVLASVRVD